MAVHLTDAQKAAIALGAAIIEMQGYSAFLRWVAGNKQQHAQKLEARNG